MKEIFLQKNKSAELVILLEWSGLIYIKANFSREKFEWISMTKGQVCWNIFPIFVAVLLGKTLLTTREKFVSFKRLGTFEIQVDI